MKQTRELLELSKLFWFSAQINLDQSKTTRIADRNKLFVGTILIKNGTISMKVGTIAVR